MADIFVDKILNNEEVRKQWIKTTRDLIKLNGFKEMIDLFLTVAADLNEEIYRKRNLPPKNWFKGNLKITDIADEFKIEPLGKKLRICPFHKDTNPSLSLNDEKGVFNCFGCGKKGNIITFYANLKKLEEELKNGDKQK